MKKIIIATLMVMSTNTFAADLYAMFIRGCERTVTQGIMNVYNGYLLRGDITQESFIEFKNSYISKACYFEANSRIDKIAKLVGKKYGKAAANAIVRDMFTANSKYWSAPSQEILNSFVNEGFKIANNDGEVKRLSQVLVEESKRPKSQ